MKELQINLTFKESLSSYEEKTIEAVFEKLSGYKRCLLEVCLKEQKIDSEFLHCYSKLVRLCDSCLNRCVRVKYEIQTSEVELTVEELRLMKKKEIVVCLLMDGPESIHEGNNKLLNRTGSHTQALKAAAFLTEQKINFYIGITVTSLVARSVHEVFTFLIDHHWNSHAYWPIECERDHEKTNEILSADDYSFFLIELFMLWKTMRMNKQPVYVREMENLAGNIKGYAPLISSVGGRCPSQNLFLPNGEIYTKGCMVGNKKYLCTNLREQNLNIMKSVDVKASCKVCRWVSLCQSAQTCCKNPIVFCNTYKSFYSFALPEMFELLRNLGK